MLRMFVVVGIMGALIGAAALMGCAEKGTTDVNAPEGVINPYEWMGEAHNEGLAFGIQELEAQSKVEIADISNVVDRFLLERGGAYPVGDYSSDDIEWEEAINPAVAGRESFLAHLVNLENEGLLSESFVEQAGRIIDLTWEEKFGSLRNLERAILESDMDELEKTGLLGGIAVACHSQDFWSARVKVGAAKISDLRPVVTADLCGALGGAIAGSLGGVLGSALGGAGGAIGASLGMYLLG